MIVPALAPTFSAGVDPAASQLLTMSQIAALVLNPPRVLAYPTAAPCGTPAANAWTLAVWGGENFDSDGMHSTATNTSRLTAVTPGLYLLSAAIGWVENTTGHRGVQIRLNSAGSAATGTNLRYGYAAAGNVTTDGMADMAECSVYQFLNAGDYVEAFGIQSSGGALASSTASTLSIFSALWVAQS